MDLLLDDLLDRFKLFLFFCLLRRFLLLGLFLFGLLLCLFVSWHIDFGGTRHVRLIIKQTHKFGLLIFLLFFGFDRKWLRRVLEEPQDIGLRTGMCLKSTVD